MKNFLIIAIMLAAQLAFAGSITDDNLDLGKPSSSATKSLTFKGPTKNKLSSTSAGALGYDGNAMTIGDGANTANKTITFNKGANSPSIRYNFSTGVIEFSNDNTNFSAMGSGSGGPGGVQLLSDPEFEKATISTYWTASAGTFTALTTGGNFSGFDKQSGSWTPAALNNTLSSETITVVNGLLGMRGVASIYYKTTGTLHKLQVYDGTNVLATTTLGATANFAKAEIYFTIPVSGTIQLRLLAGDTTPIYEDKAYLGPPLLKPVEDDFAVDKNYMSNPGAEGLSTSWLAYKDAAGITPVDGVGGSPTTTCTITNSSPLMGNQSFLITKPASNVQGEGCAHNLRPLESSLQAKVLQVAFDYKVASGTYADNQLKLYAYDIDNSQLIELAPTGVLTSAGTETFHSSFQTTVTGVNYRLIWHYAGTDATAFSLKIDNVKVATKGQTLGTIITDWVSYTPTIVGFGTPTSVGFYSRRVGDTLEIKGSFIAGTPTATQATISLGYAGGNGNVTAASSSKIASAFEVTGFGGGTVNGAAPYCAILGPNATTLYFGVGSGTTACFVSTPANGNILLGVGEGFSFKGSVPIAGWSSGMQISSDADTRVVAASYTATSGTSAGSNIAFATRLVDTHGAFSGTVFTTPVSGNYSVAINLPFSWNPSAQMNVNLLKNGSVVHVLDYALNNTTAGVYDRMASGSVILALKVGDTLSLQWQNTVNTATMITNGSNFGALSIQMLSGPSQIAASESIAARYTDSGGITIGTSAAVYKFTTATFDTHNAYSTSTGLYTCPESGKYKVSAGVISAAGLTLSISQGIDLYVYKNGSFYSIISQVLGTGGNAAYGYMINGSDSVQCNAGETLAVWTQSAIASTSNTSAGANHVSFERVGN